MANDVTYQQSQAPDSIIIVGEHYGKRFEVRIDVREIVLRTVGEANFRKGQRVSQHHGNITATVKEKKR